LKLLCSLITPSLGGRAWHPEVIKGI